MLGQVCFEELYNSRYSDYQEVRLIYIVAPDLNRHLSFIHGMQHLGYSMQNSPTHTLKMWQNTEGNTSRTFIEVGRIKFSCTSRKVTECTI